MKNKILICLLILLVSILWIKDIFAASSEVQVSESEVKCVDTSEDDRTSNDKNIIIKWTNDTETVGYVSTSCTETTKTTENHTGIEDTQSDAQSACEAARNSNPACSDPCANRSDKDKCRAGSACGPCSVTEKTEQEVVDELQETIYNEFICKMPNNILKPCCITKTCTSSDFPSSSSSSTYYGISGSKSSSSGSKSNSSRSKASGTGASKPSSTPVSRSYAQPSKPGGGRFNQTAYIKYTVTSPIAKLVAEDRGGGDSGSGGSSKVYQWSYTVTKWVVKEGAQAKTCNIKAEAAKYVTVTGKTNTSGDPAYCLQPGAYGAGDGIEYSLDSTFDISLCTDSLHRKSSKPYDMRCGLAVILHQAMYKKDSSGKEVYKPNQYSYGTITYALRLWGAQHSDFKNNPWYAIEDNGNYSTELNDYTFVASENYYKKTAQKMEAGTWTKTMVTNNHILGCKGSSNCKMTNVYTLYREAVKAEDPNYFKQIINVNPDMPKTTYLQSTYTTGMTIIDLPESIAAEVTACSDIKAANCGIHAEYTLTEKGTNITNQVLKGGSCYYYTVESNGSEKERSESYCKGKAICRIKCEVETEITPETCKLYKGEVDERNQTLPVTVRVYVDNWKRNTGYIRFYTDAKKKKHQAMMVYANKLENCEQGRTTVQADSTVIITPQCPCDPNKKCLGADITTKSNLNHTCTGDSYVSSSVTDPTMNCILNACYAFEKSKYEYTRDYNANKSICNIYCTDETKFYMPGRTSVYAGMQFRYDLGSELKQKLDEFRNRNLAEENNKLTAVITYKRKCTSEIDYAYWLEGFKKAVDKKASDKELNEMVYDLYNCNLYSQSDIPATYRNAKTAVTGKGSSKDYMLDAAKCTTDSKCPRLSGFEYPDDTYKSTLDVRNTTGLVNTNLNTTKYCRGSNCYTYTRNQEYELTGSSSTTTVSYGGKSVNVPNNDYASFTMTTERDYYQSTEYKVQALTGKVVKGKADSKDTSYTQLPSNIYPIGINEASGNRDIKYTFSGIKAASGDTYKYTCQYKVFNTTTLYNCNYKKADGTIDLSKCSTDNPTVKNGIADLSKVNWTNDSLSAQNGFFVRYVDNEDPFPGAVVTNKNGRIIISTRNDNGYTNNWATEMGESIIKKMKSVGNQVYVPTEDNQHRVVTIKLTQPAIDLIVKYNNYQSSNGGYANATLEDCKLVSDGNGQLPKFTECKSTFLNDELTQSKYAKTGLTIDWNNQ